MPTRTPNRFLERTHRYAYRAAQRLTGWDVTVLMALDWQGFYGPHRAPPGLDVRPLRPAEAARWVETTDYPLDRDLPARLETGHHWCLAAQATDPGNRDRLAGFICLARGHIDACHNRASCLRSGVAVDVGPDAAFLYNAFVHPACRGRRIYQALVGAALRWSAEDGIVRIVSTADWTNYAALRSCRRMGFQPIGRIHRIYGPLWDTTLTPRRAAEWGITFPAVSRATARKRPARQTRMSWTTWPWTSVSRKSRP